MFLVFFVSLADIQQLFKKMLLLVTVYIPIIKCNIALDVTDLKEVFTVSKWLCQVFTNDAGEFEIRIAFKNEVLRHAALSVLILLNDIFLTKAKTKSDSQ